MFTCADVRGVLDGGEPRLIEEHLRCLPGAEETGTILLLGVVHDHPASVFRVAHVLERIEPEVLALELPPLAVPLFRMYAADANSPPRLGGEMSMAVRAADGARTAGIDAPNHRYLQRLISRLSADPPSLRVARMVAKDLLFASLHALSCRLGAFVGAMSPLRPRVYSPIQYETSLLDAPHDQAGHEATHLATQRAFLRAVEIPAARRLIDTAREASMADRLGELRREGDVVAVVGMEHLDPLADRLGADPRSRASD